MKDEIFCKLNKQVCTYFESYQTEVSNHVRAFVLGRDGVGQASALVFEGDDLYFYGLMPHG
jgi:hypothetical protein